MWSSLKSLGGLLSRRQRWQAGLLVLMLVGNALLEMVGVGLVPVYIGILAQPDRVLEDPRVLTMLGAVGIAATHLTRQTLLYGGTVVLFLMFTVKLVYAPLLAYVRARYVQGVVKAQGTRLFESYMRAPYQYHLGRHSSELIRNITVECTRLGETVLNPLVGMISQFLITMAIVVLLLVSAPGTGVITLLGFALVAVPLLTILTRRTRRLAAVAQQGRQRVIQFTQEGLGGVKEIQLLRREGYFVRRFREALRQVLDLNRFVQVIHSGLPVFMEWLAVVALLLVVVTVFRPGETGANPLVVVALFAVAMARLKGSVTGMLSGYAQVRSSIVSVDVVHRDLLSLGLSGEETDRRPLAGTAAERDRFEDSIHLDDIWFRYAGYDTDVLKGISLVIRKGEAVGFVGPSGGGKSTLIDVILGILEPYRGSVKVDGVDIKQDLPRWHRNVGYIPQSIYLIDGTIRENIALGVETSDIKVAAVSRALQGANLDSMVRELPLGEDTLVGERGVRLSGGQRQRIAIARALYDDPDVLIMDEATAALDNVTEKAVMEAVEALKGERTILMIAHRLSTVRTCDRVVFLKGGEIQGIGTYADLMESHSQFRRMADAG